MISLPRFMLAAPSSGSGKTMLTCGMLQFLKNRGLGPSAYKCGPDYIDPMFHTKVLGMPSRNLDPFFTDRKTTRMLFARSAEHAGISVMEGVMGVYDGLGGITKEASSYDLAKKTDTPIILVLNAKGMSLSVIPLLKGFLDYQDPDGQVIRGVILNRTTKMTTALLKKPIEEQTGLKVIGYVPVLEACKVESRHLGLVMPGEVEDLQQRVNQLADEMEKSIDLSALLEIAQGASNYEEEEREIPEEVKEAAEILKREAVKGGNETEVPRIAIAKDEAFCFYYQDNLELLEFLGAELVEFSPIHDHHLPDHISGLLLGGGYPELYAAQLSENKTMLAETKEKIDSGIPCLAECGGFMYLHDSMQDLEGNDYPVAGCISGKSYHTGKLGRFGYIMLHTGEGQLLEAGQEIRGHEFHYFDSTNTGEDYTAVKPVTGRTWNCIHGTEKSVCGYPHLYYWSNPQFAVNFIQKVLEYKER